jgi:hypothetical protein
LKRSCRRVAALQNLGKVILANYRKELLREAEPSPQEFEVLADVFVRISEM